MSERVFRLILGASLLLLLYLQQEQLIYVYIGILMFEGLTNWRVPLLVSKVRKAGFENTSFSPETDTARIPFDAERALRIIVAVFMIVTYVIFRDEVWFFPWFIGFMLIMAGVTNICPMVMSLRWMGFR